MINAAYFFERAEQCFRLSRAEGLGTDVSTELNEMGQDLMAKAVYLDTLTKRASDLPQRATPDAHLRPAKFSARGG